MNLLVTGACPQHAEMIARLEAEGYQVLFMQQESGELPCEASWVHGVICNGLFLYHDIKAFTDLRFVQLTSAGLDRVPLKEIDSRGIRLFSAKGVYSIPMAEFAVGAVLQFYKESRWFAHHQSLKKWEKHRGLLELYHKNVCIIGCGSVGAECAKRFSAFSCDVVGVDLNEPDGGLFDRGYPVSKMKTAVSGADVVVLTLPLNESTRAMIDADVLSSMKDGAVLVNISRGAVVDTDALTRVLSQGRIRAALDVFEDEPLCEDSPLWHMDNVILTPHNSFVGDGNAVRLSKVILENLKNEQERYRQTC